METKITDVQNYFKDKILEELFEVVEISKWTAKILVDNKYTFTFWIGNMDVPGSVKTYSSSPTNEENFILLNFSETEKKQLHYVFSKILSDYEEEKRLAEIEDLRKRLKELENR